MDRKIDNRRITPPLFNNSLFEKLSHVHPITPVVLYVPVVAYFMYVAVTGGELGVGAIVGLFVAGLAFWTLLEYVIHRWAFHYETRSELGKKLHFLVHGIHHDFPRDPLRLVMPPVVSVPLALLFYGLFRWVLGPVYMAPAFSGLIVGYIAYDMIHYATHHFSLKGSKIGLYLKYYHLRHHYQDEHTAYGVSSPLWDYILHTRPEEEHPAQKKARGAGGDGAVQKAKPATPSKSVTS